MQWLGIAMTLCTTIHVIRFVCSIAITIMYGMAYIKLNPLEYT